LRILIYPNTKSSWFSCPRTSFSIYTWIELCFTYAWTRLYNTKTTNFPCPFILRFPMTFIDTSSWRKLENMSIMTFSNKCIVHVSTIWCLSSFILLINCNTIICILMYTFYHRSIIWKTWINWHIFTWSFVIHYSPHALYAVLVHPPYLPGVKGYFPVTTIPLPPYQIPTTFSLKQ